MLFATKNTLKIWYFKKNKVPLQRFKTKSQLSQLQGEMVEWSITTVLKTVVLRGTGGSNPSLSAKIADYQQLTSIYAQSYTPKKE